MGKVKKQKQNQLTSTGERKYRDQPAIKSQQLKQLSKSSSHLKVTKPYL